MQELRWKSSPLLYNCSSPGQTCCWLVDISSNQWAAYPAKFMLLLKNAAKDDHILNALLNAESPVIFLRGRNGFKSREGINSCQDFLVQSSMPLLLLPRSCPFKACPFYKEACKEESQKIWKVPLYCTFENKSKSVSKWPLSGAKQMCQHHC